MDRNDTPVKYHQIIRETETSYIVLTDTIYGNFYMTAFSKVSYQNLLDYYAKCFADINEQSLKKAGYRKKERGQILREAASKPSLDDFFSRTSVNEYRFYLGRFETDSPPDSYIQAYAGMFENSQGGAVSGERR